MNTWILPAEYTGQPSAYFAAVLAALLITGIAKGGFGGVGALAVPLLILVMPATRAVGFWLPMLIWMDVLTIRWYPRDWRLRPVLVMAPSVLAGIVAGWYLLDVLNERYLKLFVAALSVGFVFLEWGRSAIARGLARPDNGPWHPTVVTAAPFGLAAGVGTIVAHAAGAVTTIYFLLQRMDKRVFVGTSARFYVAVNTIKVPFLAQSGYIHGETLRTALWLVPLAPLAIALGVAMNRRIPAAAFVRVIHVLMVLTGGYIFWANW